MTTRRSGNAIAISSMTGKRPLYGRTPYAAAKLGVIGLVRTLATELGPYHIRVNAVCPGFVAGPRMEQVIRRQAAIRGIADEKGLELVGLMPIVNQPLAAVLARRNGPVKRPREMDGHPDSEAANSRANETRAA